MTIKYSEFFETYLKLRLSDIVVVDYSHHEERSGYQNETTTETVVARQDGKPLQLTISLYQNFAPGRTGRDPTIGAVLGISEADYQQHSAGKTILDSKEALEALEQKKQRLQQKQEAANQLVKVAPRCSTHQIALVVRLNGKNGQKFWGCPRFPICTKTHPCTIEQLRLHKAASATIF